MSTPKTWKPKYYSAAALQHERGWPSHYVINTPADHAEVIVPGTHGIKWFDSATVARIEATPEWQRDAKAAETKPDLLSEREIIARGWVDDGQIRKHLGPPTYARMPSRQSTSRGPEQCWIAGDVRRAEQTPSWQTEINASLEAKRAKKVAEESQKKRVADGQVLVVNPYGNVDISRGIDPNYAHLPDETVESVNAKGINVVAPALVRWENRTPIIEGVVVLKRSLDRLRAKAPKPMDLLLGENGL